MTLIGNLIWLIFGGLIIALEYFIASIFLMITIIGIPFGIQTIKLAALAFWPFGWTIVADPPETGCLSLIMNVLWIFLGGIWIALTHVMFGVLLYITILGIPFGMQHFKLAALALTPFGKRIVPDP
jgi:uncharacterized membrane protein YccF (DUF307 family)